MSVHAHFLPFPGVVYTLFSTSNIPTWAISLLGFVGYEFEGSLSTSLSLCRIWVLDPTKMTAAARCFSNCVVLRFFYLFILWTLLDAGFRVWVKSTRIASQDCSFFQLVMYVWSEGRNQMHSATFCKRVLVFGQGKGNPIRTRHWQILTFNSKS